MMKKTKTKAKTKTAMKKALNYPMQSRAASMCMTLGWASSGDSRITGFVAEYRKVGDADWTEIKDGYVGDCCTLVLPLGEYEFRCGSVIHDGTISYSESHRFTVGPKSVEPPIHLQVWHEEEDEPEVEAAPDEAAEDDGPEYGHVQSVTGILKELGKSQ